MKKLMFCMAVMLFTFGLVQVASAADVAAGPPVTITVTSPNPLFTPFNPSNNVIIDGATSATEFAIAAYHTQVLAKNSGKEFGMASDSSAMWFNDISATGDTATAISTSNSSSFSGWSKM